MLFLSEEREDRDDDDDDEEKGHNPPKSFGRTTIKAGFWKSRFTIVSGRSEFVEIKAGKGSRKVFSGYTTGRIEGKKYKNQGSNLAKILNSQLYAQNSGRAVAVATTKESEKTLAVVLDTDASGRVKEILRKVVGQYFIRDYVRPVSKHAAAPLARAEDIRLVRMKRGAFSFQKPEKLAALNRYRKTQARYKRQMEKFEKLSKEKVDSKSSAPVRKSLGQRSNIGLKVSEKRVIIPNSTEAKLLELIRANFTKKR